MEFIVLVKDSMLWVCKYTPSFLCYEMCNYHWHMEGTAPSPLLLPKVKWAKLSFLCKQLKEEFDL